MSGEVDEGVDGGDVGDHGGGACQEGLKEGAGAGEHLALRRGGRARISLARPPRGLTMFTISAQTFSLEQQGSVQPVYRSWKSIALVAKRRFSPAPRSSPSSEYEYDAKNGGEKEEKEGEKKEREERNFLDQRFTLRC